MLRDIKFPLSNEYRSGTENEPINFFLEALENSISFDLLLGYFSSSAINVLSLGFAHFIHRGGKVRIIANHILSSKDKEAFIKGNFVEEEAFNYDVKDLKKILNSLDDYGTHFFNCLAWLIASKKIEMIIVKPKSSRGISHFKSGVFYDEDNEKIKFKASCNFTAFGLLENLEELEVKQSWSSPSDRIAIAEQEKYFIDIFKQKSDLVEYVPFEEIEEAIIKDFGGKEINELLVNEKKLIEKRKKILNNKKTKEILERLDDTIYEKLNSPRFPYPKPRKYQDDAYKNWATNDHKGIFAMATGTGKTITSLNCLLNLYKQTKSYKAIILVPTIALVNQWEKECRKFNFSNIICVSSKQKWDADLSFFNTASKFIDTSFIVIVTYASFPRQKFQNYFQQLPIDTLLIADEMHNIGSPNVLKSLANVHLQKRIGLSATPDRKYDEVGNKGIEDFFEDKEPYTFEYSMEEAITKKPYALSKYTYYPHIVFLDNDELSEYVKKSKQLLKYFDSKNGRYKDCKEVEMLLLERKRIIHKAKNKKTVFKQIIIDEFKKRGNLKFTLVYVPEGMEADYGTNDEYSEDTEDSNLLNQYTKIVSEVDYSIMVQQFTSKTKNREELLNNFSIGETDVLCSMKCLDEGVDVPRSELAIFCASTGNPRQFIQRRGRVLRLHDDKNFATIHDLVVIPRSQDEDTFQMEKGILRKELERVVDFSRLSMNKMDTYSVLEEALDYYDLNLNDF